MIKQAIKVGNSAGVLLPRKYLGSLIEIEIKSLTKEEIKKQILELVNPYLSNIMGIYLVGSYARNEENLESDIDIVIITNKEIEISSTYHLICLEYKELVKEMKESIIEYYPMLLEAKVVLNEETLKNLLKIPITKENLGWHLKSTKSALKVVEKALETEDKSLIVNDAIIYSLILRLRSVYLVDCILKKKIGSIKGFLKYSKEIKSIKELYDLYRELKEENNVRINNIGKKDIEEAYNFIKDRLKKQEKGINGLKEKKKTIRKEN